MVDEETVEMRYVDAWNTDEIVSLYKEGNWWEQGSDNSFIPKLIKQSFVFVVAVDATSGKTIGMGRVLSDGVSDAYIQDIVISKKWRGHGLGRLIIEKLVSYCLSHDVSWIALISEPGQEGFYIPLGFTEMKRYTPFKYGTV